MPDILPGKYQHYKGEFYRVLGTGRHADSLEEYVIYQGLYNSTEFGDQPLWVRSKTAFLETVLLDNQHAPRFRFIPE